MRMYIFVAVLIAAVVVTQFDPVQAEDRQASTKETVYGKLNEILYEVKERPDEIRLTELLRLELLPLQQEIEDLKREVERLTREVDRNR